MTIATDIANIVLPIVAVAVLVICVLKIRALKAVQGALNSAIVLVPLFKKRIVITIGIAIMTVVVISAFYVIFTFGYVVPMLSFVVMAVSLIFLFFELSTAKFAVLDSGVLLPYKFVEWSELYDYILDQKENSVMFTGNSYGRYTLSSTSIMMKYNSADYKKLEQILSKNKIKHKVNN